MNQKIKGFCLHGHHKILPSSDKTIASNTSVVEIPSPKPKKGELSTKPLFTGICGSDLSAVKGKSNFDWVERPRIIGHEFCAEILELDSQYEGDLKVGDLCIPVAMLGCRKRECPACSRMKWNLCPSKQIVGFHRDGGFGQRVVLETDRVIPLMKGLTPKQGALVEPLSVVVNALQHKCHISPGQDVVISGCGIIGLMAAEIARAHGARIIITGIEQDAHTRLQKARERGFQTIVVSTDKSLQSQLDEGIQDGDGVFHGDNGKVDLLIECSGAPIALSNASDVVRPGGEICLIATYPKEVPLDATKITRTSLKLKGSMGSNKEDYFIAQKLLISGVFPSEHYVKEYAFENIEQAFSDAAQAKVVKALIQMNK